MAKKYYTYIIWFWNNFNLIIFSAFSHWYTLKETILIILLFLRYRFGLFLGCNIKSHQSHQVWLNLKIFSKAIIFKLARYFWDKIDLWRSFVCFWLLIISKFLFNSFGNKCKNWVDVIVPGWVSTRGAPGQGKGC